MNSRFHIHWSSLIFVCMLVLLLVPASASGRSLPQDRAPVDQQVIEEMQVQGQASYWVILKTQADLSPAYQMADWKARGEFVYTQLRATADGTQSGLTRLLRKQGVKFNSYWIINALQVKSDQAVLNELAAFPEVAKIVPTRTFQIPKPAPGSAHPPVNSVEWNIDRIHAPLVWTGFGVHGEGIVVANIDTGVQYDHPALVAQYRGNQGGGSFDHNYNWFDPSNVCGSPSLIPCDNAGHGTHTMGTMAGDDGAENQIGVAPGVRWIAAKGCEDFFCSDTALLASAQWILAPTDLNGANPRPDLRPQVVNNSWGGGSGDPWYQGMVQAWVASGIFPAFAAGNNGEGGCRTASSPGDYPESYAAGAFDYLDAIAGFSSRGPSSFGEIVKPNIAAPGVDVRSSVPGDSYGYNSGTSMASPHTAGTVALMWSAAPALIGDVVQTRALLDQTAADTEDLQCGGTPQLNNVWGEGKLDAYLAVSQSPMGPTGSLQGTVTDAATSLPVEGAVVEATGQVTRRTTTDDSGFYRFPVLSTGEFQVTASKFAYLTQSTNVAIAEAATTVQDFALALAPSYSLSGTVRDTSGEPLPLAEVTILGTPLPAVVADQDGNYTFASVPQGFYAVQAEYGRCSNPQVREIDLVADTTAFDFWLEARTDGFGYTCRLEQPAYLEAGNDLGLYGDDASVQVDLPFPFILYGERYSQVFVSTNGTVNFLELNSNFGNWTIPDPYPPNAAVYAFWDDLFVDAADASVRTEYLDTPPNRQFVIEWRNVRPLYATDKTMDVEIVLFEKGEILTRYRNIDDNPDERGASATLGIENAAGSTAFQYSFNEAVIRTPEFAISYSLPPSAFVEGYLTDYNDNLPLNGATVQAWQAGSLVRETLSNADGFYRMYLPLGLTTVEASAKNYRTESIQLDLVEQNGVYGQDFALRTARAEVSPPALSFLVPVGQSRTQILLLKNTGSLDMTWEIRETGGMALASAGAMRLAEPGPVDPDATSTRGMPAARLLAGEQQVLSAGEIIRSWAPGGLSLAWGVGYTGHVWLSDVINLRDHEFDVYGTPTGRQWPTSWASAWPADMAYDAGRGWMCQVNVGGDNGIYCWNPDDGSVMGSITGAFPWTGISQRGLAYRPDDDTFYIGGWNEGILYHIAGFNHSLPGEVLGQCYPPDYAISGLAWNPAEQIIWEATNSESDTIYELDPETCEVLGALGHPNPYYNGGGLEMDEAGNLWMVSQNPNIVYLMDSGVPSFIDLPWLEQVPSGGVLPPGGSQEVRVTVDASGLEPGVYQAILFILSNSGREPVVKVPLHVIVPAYMQGVNTGGKAYTDLSSESWAADKAYQPGSWGYMQKTGTTAVKTPIAGTLDDPLYQDARRGMVEYRFDGLPLGVYQVELRFAEIQKQKPGRRLFDVTAEGLVLLLAHDISGDAGLFAADDHIFYLTVTDGQLNLRFIIRRSFKEPLINAIRVTHRPDR